MTRARRPTRGWIIVGAALLAWLAIDRPWSIRPIGQPTASGPFDAVAYVDGIWASRVVPAIETSAGGLGAFLEAVGSSVAGPRTGAIQIEGRIASVDTSSRVGIALIDVDPSDGRADAAIQVGPVIGGTDLRDVLDFIQFSDFTNQIDFAAVARALNDRVLSDVLQAIDIGGLEGRRVRVTGVASYNLRTPDELPSVVPVRLIMEDQ